MNSVRSCISRALPCSRAVRSISVNPPQNLQRSIRLDLVRQLLLDPNRCDGIHLQGVEAIAAHQGFTSRSHFARRYRKQYGELPQETLQRSKAPGGSDPLP